MVGILALSLLGVSAPLVAAATVRVDSLSPMIVYNPPRYGSKTVNPDDGEEWWNPNHTPNAWNSTFPTLNDDYKQYDQAPATEPHYTYARAVGADSGPTAKLSFVGTSITLHGPSKQIPGNRPLVEGAATIEVAGRAQPCSARIGDLRTNCVIDNLDLKRHDLTVTVNSGTFYIDHFEIETGTGQEDQHPQIANCSIMGSVEQIPNRGGEFNLDVDGDWTAANISKDGDGNKALEWERAVATKNGQWMRVKVPEGYNRVEVWGAVDVDHGDFQVILEPDTYDMGEFNLNAFNLYTTQNIPMFHTLLDPKEEYKITVKSTEDSPAYLDVSQFKFYEDGYGSPALSVGAIVGIAIGAVAVLALGGLFAWWFLRRRRNKPADEGDRMDMVVDEVDVVYSPVPQDPRVMSMTSTNYPTSEAYTATSAGMAGAGVAFPSASHSHGGSSVSGPISPITPFMLGGPLTVNNPDSAIAAASADAAGAAMYSAKGARLDPPQQYHHMQHSDGGAVPAPAATSSNVIVTEAPPVYNPDWQSDGPAGTVTSGTRSDVSGPNAQSASTDAMLRDVKVPIL